MDGWVYSPQREELKAKNQHLLRDLEQVHVSAHEPMFDVHCSLDIRRPCSSMNIRKNKL